MNQCGQMRNDMSDDEARIALECIVGVIGRGAFPEDQYNMLTSEQKDAALAVGLYTTQYSATSATWFLIVMVFIGLAVCASVAAAVGFFYFMRKRNSGGGGNHVIVA